MIVAPRSDHPVLLGTAVVAYTFGGMRHAVDADHIAGIDNVTRKLMQLPQRHRPRLSEVLSASPSPFTEARSHATAMKSADGSHTHRTSLVRTARRSPATNAPIPIGDTRIGRTGKK